MKLRLAWTMIGAALLVACGDDTNDSAGGGGEGGRGGSGGSGGGGARPEPLAWQDCELFEEFPPADVPATRPGQCALVDVPLDWSEPEGATIELSVKRVPARQQPARQVWLLNGGPGQASSELEPLALRWASRFPDLEVYTTDFRGVGESTRLPCGEAELAVGETADCIARIEERVGPIDSFSTTQAAHDIIELIGRTRAEGPVYIYSVSYGTFWAHRLLQIDPHIADGVVLDSIAPPDADFAEYSAGANTVAETFFDRCAEDTLCADKLGPNPWGRVQEYFALPPEEACPTAHGIPQTTWRNLMVRALRKTLTRPLVPALVYRLSRCSPEDQDALEHLIDFVTSIPPDPSSSFSAALYMHIVLSELWPLSPLTADEYDASDAALTLAPGQTGYFQRLHDEWPVTARDEYAGQLATPGAPVLMLQGGLDPQTPDFAATMLTDDFVAQGHRLAHFPWSPHAVLTGSPLVADPENHCGEEMALAFFDDPDAELLDCIDDAAPIDFGDNADLAAEAMGQGSIWGPRPVAPGAAPSPRLARTIHQALSIHTVSGSFTARKVPQAK